MVHGPVFIDPDLGGRGAPPSARAGQRPFPHGDAPATVSAQWDPPASRLDLEFGLLTAAPPPPSPANANVGDELLITITRASSCY
jgi:hypothetical protein